MDPIRAEALRLAAERAPTPANLLRVARETSEAAARWAFVQWELRHRARAKFSRAHEMLFVREALEQATPEDVAQYHAERLLEGRHEGGVADLTASIGSDAIALALAAGRSTAFEIDAERAEYCRWNADVYRAQVDVREEDCLAAPWDFAYAFADPARRVDGRRTLDIAQFQPDPRALARRMATLARGGMKLSPMLPDAVLEDLGPCVEFLSFRGECGEAVVWMGRESPTGRWAVQVDSRERLTAGGLPPVCDAPQAYLFEADPAAIRAHALGTLCQKHDLMALGDSNGYLTGDEAIASPWLKPYRVLYHGRGDLSATKAELKRLLADRPVLKQRGASIDLPKLARQIGRHGTRAVALAIWPCGKSLRHTILEPLR